MSFKLKQRIGFVSLEGINHILKPAFTSLLSVLAIRLADDTIWGAFVPLLISIEIAMTVLNWGQKPYLLRSFSLNTSNISESWLSAFLARITLIIPMLVVFWFLETPRIYFIWIVPWMALRFFSQSLEPVIQFERKYLVSIFGELVSIIAACAFVFFNRNISVLTLIQATLLGQLFKASVFIQLIPNLRFSVNWIESTKRYFRYAFPFLLLSLIGLLQAKIDLYLVAWLMPDSDTAFYHVLSGFLVMLQTGAFIILGPFQKNIYRMSNTSLMSVKKKYVLLGVGFSISGAILIWVILSQLYLFEVSIEILALIIGYSLPLFFYLIESQILLKHKQETPLLISTATSAIAGFIACYLMIPAFGLVGALLGGIFARLVIVGMVLYYTKTKLHAQK